MMALGTGGSLNIRQPVEGTLVRRNVHLACLTKRSTPTTLMITMMPLAISALLL